jgi:ubiquinone/menaquinone biosynthesis C-methylase UbiE
MSLATENRIAELYNSLKDVYDENLAFVPFFINCYAMLDRVMDRVLDGKHFGRILEVGCGPGIQTVRLARHGKEVVGLDIAEDLMAVAQERCRSFPNVRFVKEDARALSFRDGSFDLVFSYGDVISHIIDGYEDAIQEMSRVARAGGIITFEIDNKWHPGFFYDWPEFLTNLKTFGRGNTAREWGGMHFKTFTHPELKGLLEKYDLTITGYYGHNILASLVPDRYILEGRSRTIMGRLALWLGRLDLWVAGVAPFNRLGFNTVVVARKK